MAENQMFMTEILESLWNLVPAKDISKFLQVQIENLFIAYFPSSFAELHRFEQPKAMR
jgi:hypothetical protein